MKHGINMNFRNFDDINETHPKRVATIENKGGNYKCLLSNIHFMENE